MSLLLLAQQDGAESSQNLSDIVEATETQIETISYWELIAAGGWYIMIPLGVLLAVSIFIFLERYMAIGKALKSSTNIIPQIKAHLQSGNIDAAKSLCLSADTPIARMVGKGISRIGNPLGDITNAIENAGKLEIYRLEKYLSTLATIAGAAPMIGFLGTTIGMIQTFHTMTVTGVEIENLSEGIMQAMVTTVGGLIVGILAYVAYNTLVSKVEKVIHNMEGNTVDFLDVLHEPGA